ncbi:MAG: hypothetical protein M3R25_08650 [Bacteroidota bacterium]|nr:hypothetical protein [Bacteroidota bacterium]
MANRTFLPSAPNNVLWILALIVGILGILAHYVPIEPLSGYSWEMLLIGFILLVLGTSFRRM